MCRACTRNPRREKTKKITYHMPKPKGLGLWDRQAMLGLTLSRQRWHERAMEKSRKPEGEFCRAKLAGVSNTGVEVTCPQIGRFGS